MKDRGFYAKLFFSTFYLSAFTFGGGYVIVPLMRKKFVEEYHWLEEGEMLDMTAIAQSAPGPIAVNAAILVGYRLRGVWGALVSILGTILPPLIIISVISLGYTAFRDNAIVSMVLRGMQAGVTAVIANVVISMAWDIIKEKRILPVLVMAGAFLLSVFTGGNVLVILLGCGAIGAVDTLRAMRRAGK